MNGESYNIKLLAVFFLICVIQLEFSSLNANVLGNPPYVVDGLKIIEGAENLLNGAQLFNVRSLNDKTAIELESNATSGSILLAPITTEFPFNEAIPSWNGWAPTDGGFRVWLRVNLSNGKLSSNKSDWTPWIEA